MGRSDLQSGGQRFSLSGTSMDFHFNGSGLTVRMHEESLGVDPTNNTPYFDEYQVVVDGNPTSVLTTRAGDQEYLIASGLPKGEHLISLFKRTETLVGSSVLLGSTVAEGQLLVPPTRPDRRIEFIGDSVVAGYGDEGKDRDCHFTPSTENQYLSFAALTARALGAEQVAVAYTGKGILRNMNGSTDETMPEIYPRAVLSDPRSLWNFGNWVPQVVVLEIGMNDFMVGVPNADAFVQAYEAFVRTVRSHYPKAHLIITLGPLLNDFYPEGELRLTHARNDLLKVVNDLAAAGDHNVQFLEFPPLTLDTPMGCEWHPSLATHAQMAQQLTQAIQATMGW